tara:strand:- start:97 stop:399 length:303 start_codon:yes stop_codon:yes gene_type:complete
MAISKKRVLGNDGHNMTLESEYSSEESSSDSYEIDERIRRKRESSGRTKKAMATRRGLDNLNLRNSLMRIHNRYFMNGSCRSLSRKEIERFEKDRMKEAA